MILLMMPRVSASTASSCSGVIVPRRPRTRSISAWRTVSRCSCSETMVGTTSSVCSRAWNLSTSSLHDGFGAIGFYPPVGNMRGDHLLQVVDVVNEDAVQLVHLRIDVARHRDIDEEHRTVAAAAQELLAMLFAEDGMRRAGGADHDVGAGNGLVELLEGDGLAIELLAPAPRARS